MNNYQEISKQFTSTAVYNGNYYQNFGIIESIANLYGRKPEEVCEVQLVISEDQTVSDDNTMKPDYWGWWCNERNQFTLIYPKRFLLNMCFAYGIRASESVNQGKAYRLEIVKHEKI